MIKNVEPILFYLGHYVYIESSRPRTRGQKARLISTNNPATSGSCLQFYYHMYGSQIGNLSVYAQQSGIRGRPIWTKSGNQGNMWIEGEVTVTAQSTWMVSGIFVSANEMMRT